MLFCASFLDSIIFAHRDSGEMSEIFGFWGWDADRQAAPALAELDEVTMLPTWLPGTDAAMLPPRIRRNKQGSSVTG